MSTSVRWYSRTGPSLQGLDGASRGRSGGRGASTSGRPPAAEEEEEAEDSAPESSSPSDSDDGLLSDGDDEMDADEVEFNRVLDQRAARDARSIARAVGNS